MDRKRANTAPLLLENRSMHNASQNDPYYSQFPSLEPKISKLLPDIPYSLSPEYKFTTSFKEELLDLWPELPSFGPVSQSEVQYNNVSGAGSGNNEQVEPSLKTAEAPSNCSPSTSRARRRRRTHVPDSITRNDVPIVDLSDSPTSQNSYSSEEDSDVVIYEGTTRREPRMDGSVVCLDSDDKETEQSLNQGDQIGDQSITSLPDIKDSEPSTNAKNLSSPSQSTGNDDKVTSNSSESQKTSSKQSASSPEQFSHILEQKIESERAIVETLKHEIDVHKQNHEWAEAKIHYLETKLQERNDFEDKLESVNALNDMLEKKLADLEKSASNLPVYEKELKRLREKTKILEEDKQCKEELGQTIANLIDDKTSLKEQNESLTSIGSMLQKEIFDLKQKCDTLEKAAENATICTGDNFIAENCCIRTKELRDRMTESLENEFKCSICEEIFIEATVTNCNHVFCAHCLSEWMKKKRDCPYCRKHVSQQCRAPVIDEFVLSMCKLLSEKAHTDRLQVVQERKILTSKKVPQPTLCRKGSGGAVRVVPIANLRNNMPPTGRPMSHVSSYMRSAPTLNSTSTGLNYYPSAMEDGAYEYFFSQGYNNGASSTATATATSSMASSSTPLAAPVQMLPLDARIPRPLGSSAQSTVTAPSSMHVSSTSSTTPMAASATAPLSSATVASSPPAQNPIGYTYSNWSRTLGPADTLSGYMTATNSGLYTNSRPTIAAVNPFSTMDEAASQRTQSNALRTGRFPYVLTQGVQDQ